MHKKFRGPQFKLIPAYKPHDVEKRTASLYAPLWEQFNRELFDESILLFGKRLKENGVNLKWFKGKTCLDAGCGGGRYVVAMSMLGAKKVVGIDMNYRGLKDAQARIKEKKLKNVLLKHGSILHMPFPNHSFDFVCCNGVLHHTIDPSKGLKELVRVLKPKGVLFFYVYGRGGLMWACIDCLRTIGQIIPASVTKKVMTLLGMPANSQFHWLDLMYVPIQKRYGARETRRWLESNGLKNIRLLEKERYPHPGILAKLIDGEGELRFLASN